MPAGRVAHYGIAKEAVFGTAVAATDYFRFRGGETLKTDPEELTPPNILGVPDEGPTYQGLKTHGGDVSFDLHPNILGFFLLSALGPVTTVNQDVGVRWRHTFARRGTEFSSASWLQPLTFEAHRDLGQAFQYAGSVVNTFRLQVGVDARVAGGTGGIIAKTMARIIATTPTFEATQAWRWNQIAIALPDPTSFTTMRSIELTIDNQQKGVDYIDGTQEIAHIRPGDGSLVIGVAGTMRGNSAEFTEFINGTERYLRVTATGATLGTGTFRLELRCPKFRYLAKDLGVAGPGEIFVGFRGKAKFDSAVADTPLAAILDNSKASY